MIKYFSQIFLILFSFFSSAQTFPSYLWHEGKIVKEKGDTSVGFVKYQLTDSIYFKKGRVIQGFSSRDIFSYQILDQSCKCVRQFYSLPYANVGQYKTPVFFEMIADGEVTLLAKERIENQAYPTGHIAYPPRPKWVLVNKYFILKDDGSIETLFISKKKLSALMGTRAKEVFRYAKKKKLNIDKKYQLKLIVDYYNSITKNNL